MSFDIAAGLLGEPSSWREDPSVSAPTPPGRDRPTLPLEWWELELGDGEQCPIDGARSAGMLVIVVRGTLALRTRTGAGRAFRTGSLVAPGWVAAVAFENPGPGALRLLGLSRRTTIGRAHG